MSNFNLCVLVGRLTRDIELKFTPKGSAVAKMGLAINRSWKSEGGEKKESTSFIDCTIWGKTAEIMSQYLKKGSPVLVQGRVESESWDDKTTGQKRTKLGVVVESFQFMDSGKGERSAPSATSAPSPKSEQSDSPEPPKEGDDVPF